MITDTVSALSQPQPDATNDTPGIDSNNIDIDVDANAVTGSDDGPQDSDHDHHHGVAVSFIDDYLYRPLLLESVSLLDFCCRYERDLKDRLLHDGVSMNFIYGHPLFRTHRMMQRKRQVVPVEYGLRVPDQRLTQEDAYPDLHSDDEKARDHAEKKLTAARQCYGLRLYLAFVPFRKSNLEVASLKSDAYRVWMECEPNISDEHRNLIRNKQCYWLAKTENSHRGFDGDEIVDHDDNWDRDDAGHLQKFNELQKDFEDANIDPAALADGSNLTLQPCASLQSLRSSGFLQHLPLVHPCQNPFQPTCNKQQLVSRRQRFDRLVPSDVGIQQEPNGQLIPAAAPDTYTNRPLSKLPAAEWVAHNEEDVDSGKVDPATLRDDVRSCVNHFASDSSIPASFRPAADQASLRRDALSILNFIMAESKLTKDQARLFLLVARDYFLFFHGLSLDPPPAEDAAQPLHSGPIDGTQSQLLLHLAGAAGTGKSRCIEAIRKLYGTMGHHRSLLLCATTGSAAVALKAGTLHNAMGFAATANRRHTAGSNALKEPSEKVRDRLQRMHLLIIDECSMVSCGIFEDMDKRLKHVKNQLRPFGGVSILFVGDFCQLGPVAAPSLMATKELAAMKWRNEVDEAICLTQQMRQADDPEYSRHLENLRRYDFNEETMSYFNSKVLEPGALESHHATLLPSSETTDADLDRFIPIVVFTNNARHQISQEITDTCLSNFRRVHPLIDTHTQFFEVVAVYGEKSLSVKVNSDLHQQLSLVKRQQSVHSLRLFIGMKVVIGKNIQVNLGIANGTQAIVQKIQLTPEAEALEPLIGPNGWRVLPITHVACVILRLINPGQGGKPATLSNAKMLYELGPGEFMVEPDNEELTWKNLGPNFRNRHIHARQLPISSALCMTGHRVQGMTLPQLIFAPDGAAQKLIYVVLSRVRSLAGLHLLTPISVKAKQSKLQTADINQLLNEMKRIDRVAEHTLTNHKPFFDQFTEMIASTSTGNELVTVQPDSTLPLNPQLQLDLRSDNDYDFAHPGEDAGSCVIAVGTSPVPDDHQHDIAMVDVEISTPIPAAASESDIVEQPVSEVSTNAGYHCWNHPLLPTPIPYIPASQVSDRTSPMSPRSFLEHQRKEEEYRIAQREQDAWLANKKATEAEARRRERVATKKRKASATQLEKRLAADERKKQKAAKQQIAQQRKKTLLHPPDAPPSTTKPTRTTLQPDLRKNFKTVKGPTSGLAIETGPDMMDIDSDTDDRADYEEEFLTDSESEPESPRRKKRCRFIDDMAEEADEDDDEED